MSELQPNRKVASLADPEAFRAELERAESAAIAVELPAAVDDTTSVAEAAPLPVEVESAPVPEAATRLGYADAIARRREIKAYLDPVFAARTILSKRDDVEEGTFRREWFKTAKQMLVDAGYPVDGKLRQGDFFAKVDALQAEDRVLKDQTAAERAERKARATRERTTPTKTPRQDRRQAKPSTSGHVTQKDLDSLEGGTKTWEIDSHEDDTVARERFRRDARRAVANRTTRRPIAPPPPGYEPLPDEDDDDNDDDDGRVIATRDIAPPPPGYGPLPDEDDIFGLRPIAPPPPGYSPLPEYDAEADMTITEARNHYARLIAKDRTTYFGRFLTSDSRLTKLLLRIPGVGRIADAMNSRQSRKKDQAQFEYEMLTNDITDEIVASVADQQLVQRKAWMINESLALEQAIADYTKDLSKDAGVFTNWWMSQEGTKFGWVKKGAAIAAGGAIVAAGVTALLPAVFGVATGAIAGGATGGYVAHRVTKRRNNADVMVGHNATMSHADYEAAYSMNDQFDMLNADDTASASSMTDIVEAKTNDEMLRNRNRVLRAKGVGAAAGSLTGLGIGRLHELWDSHSQSVTDAQAATEKAEIARQAAEEKANALEEQLAQQASSGDSGSQGGGSGGESGGEGSGAGGEDSIGVNDGPITTDSTIEVLQGNSFIVEHGNGFIKEWGQWANLNGHKIDSQTAEQLHRAVIDKFGTDGVIDLKTLPTHAETYIQNGDLRIGAPGSAQWQPGVADFARDWLKSQGKW